MYNKSNDIKQKKKNQKPVLLGKKRVIKKILTS